MDEIFQESVQSFLKAALQQVILLMESMSDWRFIMEIVLV